jgi:hypothetical protein
MRNFIVVAFVSLFVANSAFAAICEEQAAEKKLAGAAKSSFMKKCEADAVQTGGPSCDVQAAEKRLDGAAKSSFMKKCAADAKQ